MAKLIRLAAIAGLACVAGFMFCSSSTLPVCVTHHALRSTSPTLPQFPVFRSPSQGVTPVIFNLIRGKDTKGHLCPFYVVLSIRAACVFNEYVIVLEQGGSACATTCAEYGAHHFVVPEAFMEDAAKRMRISLWESYDESKHFFLCYFFVTYMPNYFINLTRVASAEVSQRHLEPLIGFKHFVFPGTDALMFVSAEDVAAYFVNRRAKLAVPLYMPGANNYFSYFTVDAFHDFCQCVGLFFFCSSPLLTPLIHQSWSLRCKLLSTNLTAI